MWILRLEGELIKLAHYRDLEIVDEVLISIQFVVFYACITISVLEDLAVKGSTFAQ